MDVYEQKHFLMAMQEDNGKVLDLADGIYHAMQSVPEFEGPRWFGTIGNGTFFANLETWKWFPESDESESVDRLADRYGYQLVEGL